MDFGPLHGRRGAFLETQKNLQGMLIHLEVNPWLTFYVTGFSFGPSVAFFQSTNYLYGIYGPTVLIVQRKYNS